MLYRVVSKNPLKEQTNVEWQDLAQAWRGDPCPSQVMWRLSQPCLAPWQKQVAQGEAPHENLKVFKIRQT